MLWRLLRIGSAPYFVLGVGGAATAPLHATVDAAMPLSQPHATLVDYQRHLLILQDWFAARVNPTVYRPLAQDPTLTQMFAARTSGDG